jgi:hypothetical protein
MRTGKGILILCIISLFLFCLLYLHQVWANSDHQADPLDDVGEVTIPTNPPGFVSPAEAVEPDLIEPPEVEVSDVEIPEVELAQVDLPEVEPPEVEEVAEATQLLPPGIAKKDEIPGNGNHNGWTRSQEVSEGNHNGWVEGQALNQEEAPQDDVNPTSVKIGDAWYWEWTI